MDTKVQLRRQFKESMAAEIATRTAAHQAEMAALRIGRENLLALGAAPAAEPLVMLAHGDSWFDYPLYGNGPLPAYTDVTVQLKTLGAVHPKILNISQWGDATTDEMSLPKQQRLVTALSDPANWGASGKPDAILFSGGGNDIAGDRFCIFLDYNTPGSNGLDPVRFNDVLASIEGSYLDLFAFRDRYAPGVPIFGHAYDFPIPNGVHPICTGPWLQPSLAYCGWTDAAAGARIVHDALLGFEARLTALANLPAHNFHLVPTQGTLQPSDWANELHPQPEGFVKIAQRFAAALHTAFPTRI